MVGRGRVRTVARIPNTSASSSSDFSGSEADTESLSAIKFKGPGATSLLSSTMPGLLSGVVPSATVTVDKESVDKDLVPSTSFLQLKLNKFQKAAADTVALPVTTDSDSWWYPCKDRSENTYRI